MDNVYDNEEQRDLARGNDGLEKEEAKAEIRQIHIEKTDTMKRYLGFLNQGLTQPDRGNSPTKVMGFAQ